MMKVRNRSPTIHALLTLDRRPDMSAVTAKMQSLLSSYPLFRARISVPGSFERDMYWEIPTAIGDAKDYVKEVALELPAGDAPEAAITARLNAFVCTLISKDSFDRNLGQWELYYVTYYQEAVVLPPTPDTSSSSSWSSSSSSSSGDDASPPPPPPTPEIQTCHLVFRIHHAIGDGVLLSKVITSILDPATAPIPSSSSTFAMAASAASAAAVLADTTATLQPSASSSSALVQDRETSRAEDEKYERRRKYNAENSKPTAKVSKHCCTVAASALSAVGKILSLPASFSDPPHKVEGAV